MVDLITSHEAVLLHTQARLSKVELYLQLSEVGLIERACMNSLPPNCHPLPARSLLSRRFLACGAVFCRRAVSSIGYRLMMGCLARTCASVLQGQR